MNPTLPDPTGQPLSNNNDPKTAPLDDVLNDDATAEIPPTLRDLNTSTPTSSPASSAQNDLPSLPEPSPLSAPEPAPLPASLPEPTPVPSPEPLPEAPKNQPADIDNSVEDKSLLTGPGSLGGGEETPAVDTLPPDEKPDLGTDTVLTEKSALTEKHVKVVPGVKFELNSFLAATFDQNASDLHLAVGYPPTLRVDGNLTPIGGEKLTKEQIKELVYSALTTEQRELLEVNKEVDLAIDYEGKARFRVNAFTEKGVLSAAFRLIPSKIRTLDELNLPKKLHEFCKLEQGLILVTGPTGHGKSTTLAALLQEINQNQDRHIITIEDPIEYVFPKSRGLVQQRELHQDTHSWEVALRSVLREDPDVVMVGEMRDFETIAATITVAETGHLVFATLHTNSAAQSIDRIIDVFPPHQQGQIRVQLANVLEGVISQRLLPKIGGGRVAAVELMMATPAVRNLIREQKTYQIDNIISTSFDFGMQTIERALAQLVSAGSVDAETAKRYSVRPEELDKLLNRSL